MASVSLSSSPVYEIPEFGKLMERVLEILYEENVTLTKQQMDMIIEEFNG